MAILKGFPPSNTISCVTRIPEDYISPKSVWNTRRDVFQMARDGLGDMQKYFHNHAVNENEQDDLMDVAWATYLCFGWDFFRVDYNMACYLNPEYGRLYLKWKSFLLEPCFYETGYEWAEEKMKTDPTIMDIEVREKLLTMGWTKIERFKASEKGVESAGWDVLCPRDEATLPKYEPHFCLRMTPASKARLLAALEKHNQQRGATR